ncbi:MAG: caspase family protein, partial [Saprospiraceae bacterium]|nr:caspase family protein [Saprospiraceae bacterium]
MKKIPSLIALVFLNVYSLAQKPRLVVPVGHTNSFSQAVFSPNGKQVLTCNWDQTAKLWDISGRELVTYSGHNAPVWSVAFSPPCREDPDGGNLVLTGGMDGTAKLWDLTGKELITFYGHRSYVCSVAFSPQNPDNPCTDIKVLTGSSDGTARLWDLNGNELITFDGHGKGSVKAAFSPNGTQVLTWGSNGQAMLWDLDGKFLADFTTPKNNLNAAAFSPNGKQVLTAHADSTARLWNLSGELINTFTGHTEEVVSIAFSPDGKTILTGSIEGYIKLWDLSGRCIQTFPRIIGGVRSISCSPYGKQILISGQEQVTLWNLSGEVLSTFAGHANVDLTISFSPNGKQILAGGCDGRPRIWDLTKRGLNPFSRHSHWILSAAFSPACSNDPSGGRYILTGSDDSTAMLWNTKGQILHTFTNHNDVVTSVSFSPDGKKLAVGSVNHTAMVFDLSGKVFANLQGHTNIVEDVDFSPDGKNILTASDDSTAILWNLSGEIITRFKGHTNVVRSIAVSPDGKTILTGSYDHTAVLWDLTGEPILRFTEHSATTTSVAFSPDGKQILTGSDDGTAMLWSLSGKGSYIRSFSNQHNRINSVAFSPPSPTDPQGGKYVMTSGWDGTIKIWNAQTGAVLATLVALDSIDWVVTTPSGLFDASPGAMKLMYFVVGKDLDIVELEQLKERYYEPGLLAKVMGFSGEPIRGVKGLDSVALYPNIRLELDSLKNQLHIYLRARSGGIGKVSVFVNDKEIIEDANPLPLGGGARDTVCSVLLDKFIDYFLPDSSNTISVRVYNAEGWLKSAPISIPYRPVLIKAKGDNKGRGEIDTPIIKKRNPSLHIISIGTADYAGTELDLKYASKDARDMANALEQIGRQLFIPLGGKVHVHCLTTESANYPSKTNIMNVFDEVRMTDKAEDIVVVFFSGHGITYGDAERSLFYYLTGEISGFDLSDIEIRENRAVSSNELTQWLTRTHARKQVLIFDACNSGRLVETFASGSKELSGSQIRALERMKDRTGLFVLAGSA